MDMRKLKLKIHDIRCEAKNILLVELRSEFNKELPEFTAGSHLEFYLKNDLLRHYSLLNNPAERDRYLIAVSLDPDSRGGSRFIHQKFRVGDWVSVSMPRNHFPLLEAEQYCFIAGGIGITPILSMIHWCIAHQKKWRLYYSVRNRQRAAFYESLLELGHRQNIHFHFNDEHENLLDLNKIVAESAQNEQIYCCGPNPFMLALKECATGMSERLHFEWFSAPQAPPVEHESTTLSSDFTLRLARSGQEIVVASEQSVLEAIEAQGLEVPFSCRAGICRACECKVLNGEPEHLDMVLTESEKQANQSMLICVSRSRTKILELDI